MFLFFLVGVLTIPESSAQDAIHGTKVGGLMIINFTFAQGIGFLTCLQPPDGEISIENDIAIPTWIKNNAEWWA